VAVERRQEPEQALVEAGNLVRRPVLEISDVEQKENRRVAAEAVGTAKRTHFKDVHREKTSLGHIRARRPVTSGPAWQKRRKRSGQNDRTVALSSARG
jgi:hypothetical protein